MTTCVGPHGKPPISITIGNTINDQYQLLNNAFQALYALFPNDTSVQVFTPVGDGAPAPDHINAIAPNTLYVENITPNEGGYYNLALKANALIFAGSNDAHLIGRAGAPELLVGNDGNDTIRGHGGTGTIIAGNGSNHIHSGHGNMVISTGTGNDTIHTGMGSDTVTTGLKGAGVATVFAGSGNDVYYDHGQSGKVFVGSGNATLFAGSGVDDFTGGGSGITVMYSGTGSDTFTAGSGFNVMQDTGTGSTTFDFNSTFHGTSLVEGFDASRDSISLDGYKMSTLIADTTVAGGNSFVNLGDGTKIVFVGVDITKLGPSSFH